MDNLTVKYQAVNGQTRTPLLVNGTVDLVCATTTNTFSRQQQVDFLNTMFVTGNRLLVKKNSGIKEIEDLKGKVVSANQGTTNEKVLNELNQKLNLGIKILPTKDQPQAWIALETDRTDAHMTDEVVEYGLIAKSKNPADYAVVGRLLSFDPYAIVIRRDDSAFRSLGNKVLADLYRNGEIGADLHQVDVDHRPAAQPRSEAADVDAELSGLICSERFRPIPKRSGLPAESLPPAVRAHRPPKAANGPKRRACAITGTGRCSSPTPISAGS